MTPEEKRRILAELRAAEAAYAAEARRNATQPDANAFRLGAFSEDDLEAHEAMRAKPR